MKHFKTLSLSAVAAMALMAFGGADTAPAIAFCKTNVSPCPAGEAYPAGTAIHATLKSGTKLSVHDTFNIVKNECTEATIHGETTNESGTTVNGNVNKLSFGGCTMTTDVLEETGTLSINSSGTVSGTGLRITVPLGSESCIYGLGAGTNRGTFVGGNPAHITVNATLNKQPGSGANCLADTKWTATYVITEPKPLYVTS